MAISFSHSLHCCVVTAAVSAPLLDVLASAAVEQPPLEMPAAAAAAAPQSQQSSTSDSVTEPMPTVLTDAQDAEAVHTTSTPLSVDLSLLVGDESVVVPVNMATMPITTHRFGCVLLLSMHHKWTHC